MALESGKSFGSYRIVEQIGAGGMGEVYRATDTNLKREVALKVLPAAFVEDQDRLARFQREAEILAALNHPNIAQVYGLEKAQGQTAIVMELVDGPTLADRIAEGPISPDEAMGIALQIVSALEAAHEKSIVHRDLKPANVKVMDDGTVKVLDFGISKPIDASAISGGVAATPAVTQTGVILGTAAYMSPEQARGKFVDQRTDVWAFGCLLFEMLTGQPAFAGEDIMAILARVIDRDTDLSSMPGSISPAVRHTIRLCLEKDPKKRIHHIGDVRLALDGTFETEFSGAPVKGSTRALRRALPISVMGAIVLTGAAFWFLKPDAPPVPSVLTRFDIAPPDGLGVFAFNSILDIAPNGEFVVFTGPGGVYLRLMGDPEVRVIVGTEEASSIRGGDPVVSPDSRDVAFFRSSAESGRFELVKIGIDGAGLVSLADSLDAPFGLSWEEDGTLLFGQPNGIWRVSESAGTPEHLIETGDGEQAYGPQLLPDSEWVLFTLAQSEGPNRWDEAVIVVESLQTDDRHVLGPGRDARYLSSGHITYVSGNVLSASAADPSNPVLGESFRLVPEVQVAGGAGFGAAIGGGGALYAVSNNGTLAYIPGRSNVVESAVPTAPVGADAERNLVWSDREGNSTTLPVPADAYTTVRVSPDGAQAALVVGAVPGSAGPDAPASARASDIYLLDLETMDRSQITFGPDREDGPVWSADSRTIYYRSYTEDGGAGVYRMSAEGGDAEFLFSSPEYPNLGPWSVLNEGELLLTHAESLNDADIEVLDLETLEITRLLDEDMLLLEPSVSPVEPWMLYYESDGFFSRAPRRIYLRPYPDVSRRQIEVALGKHAVFSVDGSEVFFFDDEGLAVVPVQYGPLDVGDPMQLFRAPEEYWWGGAGPDGSMGRAWDVDPLNDRFLMISNTELDTPAFEPPAFRFGGAGNDQVADQVQPQIRVVINWFAELTERVQP